MKQFGGLLFVASALWGQAPVSYADAIIPHMPVGCGFTATIVLMNLTDKKDVAFTVNFWPPDGKKDLSGVPVRRLIPIQDRGLVGSVSDKIPANGSYVIRSDESGRNNPDCYGWAEVSSEESIGGYVVLNERSTGLEFETTVPFSSRFANRFLVPFDATKFRPAIALVNPSFQIEADVTVTYRYGDGRVICVETRKLKPGAQLACELAPSQFVAPDSRPQDCVSSCYWGLQGRAGVAEFVTSNLELSGFALRFADLGFVSFPAQSPIGR